MQTVCPLLPIRAISFGPKKMHNGYENGRLTWLNVLSSELEIKEVLVVVFA